MVWPFTTKPTATKSASYSLDSPGLMNMIMRGETPSLNAVGPETVSYTHLTLPTKRIV